MPTANYDNWKLASPPWYDREEIEVESCAHCRAELYAGEEVVTDNNDNFFCDMECAEAYVQKNLQDYTELFESLINTKRLGQFRKWLLKNWLEVDAWEYIHKDFTTVELENPESDYDY